MKKGLLIYRINKDDLSNAGVINKINGQYAAFKKEGIHVDLFCLGDDGIFKNNKLIHTVKLKPNSIGLYIFYLFGFGRMIKKYNDFSTYDFIYLRHPFFDPVLSQALKHAKKLNPGIKILLEINTFPYDKEPKRILHRLSLLMDSWLRKGSQRFIDRVIHYGSEKHIWNIPTINIQNGVDTDKLRIAKYKKEENKLRIIGIGNWSYWHGLDRLIKGLVAYYKNPKEGLELTIKLIGNFAHDRIALDMISKSGLKEKLEIHAPAFGEKLEEYFEEADLGLGTLAIHRKGVKLDSSLKHREYCARGVPFFYAGNDPDFNGQDDFSFRIPADDTPIDFTLVIERYQEIIESGLKERMRRFAVENLSWSVKLKPVFEYISKN